MRNALLTVLALGAAGAMLQAEDQPDLSTPLAKFSYAIGADTGNQARAEKVEIDIDLVVRGIKDSLAGKCALDEATMREAFRSFITEHRKKIADQNKVESEKFLADNKAKPGVITLPSGLQYKVLAEGSGPSPTTNDLITVNYRGTLIDGTEFDNSAKQGKPAEMSPNRVIRGWREALLLMKAGAKWELYIPSELGYGPGRSGRIIGPNSALIFEVEMVSFKPAPPPAAPTATPTMVRPANSEPVTSDIIKVPSKEEMEKGAKIEVIKKEDIEKVQKEQAAKTNAPAAK